MPDIVRLTMASSIPYTFSTSTVLEGTTSDIPVSTGVTVVVSDSSAHSITVTTEVHSDGTYTTSADLSTLAPGLITATPHVAESTGEIVTGQQIFWTIITTPMLDIAPTQVLLDQSNANLSSNAVSQLVAQTTATMHAV